MQVFAMVLFFLAGVAFGYALEPPLAWFPVLFPVVLAAASVLQDGVSGSLVVRLVAALVATTAGVILGQYLSQQRHPEQAPG